MPLKEAKKILKKEGFYLIKFGGPSDIIDDPFSEYESPEIYEARDVVNSAGYGVGMHSEVSNERKARLKKEYGKNTKAPGSGGEQPEEKIRIICCSALPKADFYYKHVLNEGNPALKESASQFNDALLDEQAKKIKCIKEKNLRLCKEIARLNKNIYKKNMKIEELRKESSRHLRGKIKMFGENVDLEQMLKDKDAVLSDVAEELRLSKIREKNLTEVGQKYMKENEELKNELDAFKESYKRRLKEDSEHFEHIQKICNVGLQKWLLESEYLENDKPFRFPQLPDFNEEEEKKHSLFRDDSVGAVTNQKDCSPVKDTHPTVDIAEEGGDHSAIIARCCKNIAISKDEAEIIERCTKDGTELHYSEKDGFTYTNMFGDEMPIICLRGMCKVFTDEEIKNMKK